jgi:hypothetical protein
MVFRGEKMKRYFGISLACFSSLLLVAGVVLAKPTTEPHVFSPAEDGYLGVVGPANGTPAVSMPPKIRSGSPTGPSIPAARTRSTTIRRPANRCPVGSGAISIC